MKTTFFVVVVGVSASFAFLSLRSFHTSPLPPINHHRNTTTQVDLPLCSFHTSPPLPTHTKHHHNQPQVDLHRGSRSTEQAFTRRHATFTVINRKKKALGLVVSEEVTAQCQVRVLGDVGEGGGGGVCVCVVCVYVCM